MALVAPAWQKRDPLAGGLQESPLAETTKPSGENTPAQPAKTRVRGVARAYTVNGTLYPDAAVQFPTAFAQDPNHWISLSLQGVNRTRTCTSQKNLLANCSDGEFYLDITPLRTQNFSMAVQWGVQSLSSRNNGTPAFSGNNLGFKLGWNLDELTAISFGGEHVIYFDDSIDLGKNYYFLLSRAQPLNNSKTPPVLVATVGVGSDFYGYGSNGTLWRSDCGAGSITSKNYPNGTDCAWGLIGSLALAFNDRISLGVEWYGYGVGAGISVRPFSSIPLNLSFYITDFLGDVPVGIGETCTTDPCQTRFYGRASLSF